MSHPDSPYTDPPLRLTVEGLRWMGEEFESSGDGSARLDLHGTDSDEDAVAVLRALRKIAARRLWMALLAASVTQGELDFEAPNAPTEEDVRDLIVHLERALGAAQVLAQLSPEIVDDEAG